MVTFWKDKNKTTEVYVFYDSVTSWNHVFLAKVDYIEEIVQLWCGTNLEDRRYISEFSTSVNNGTDKFCSLSNREIISHVKVIIRGAQPSDRFMLLNLHLYSLDYNYMMVDATNFSSDQIVQLICGKYDEIFKSGENKHDYYCGITNDLDIRMEAHRNKDFSIVDNKVYAWNCSTATIAADVEKRLGDLGFDIGNTATVGNGGVHSFSIVYLLKKGKKVDK